MRRRRFAEAFERVEQHRSAIDDRAYAALLYSAAQTARDERLGDPEPFALRALALEPGNGHVLRLLDGLYSAAGDEAKRADLRSAELGAPLTVAADFARRSHRLLEDGRLEDALAAAHAGLACAPGDGVLSFNAALAAARLHIDDEALAHLAAIGDDDAHAASASRSTEILRRSGDLDGAAAELRRVRASDRRATTTRCATRRSASRRRCSKRAGSPRPESSSRSYSTDGGTCALRSWPDRTASRATRAAARWA